MSSSTHQIKVKGVDQTAAVFGSIKSRAAATGAQIRSMMGGALAAAGAYVGFRAIRGSIAELAHLDDMAMKTSSHIGELTSAAQALEVLGIQNMSVEQLGKSFDYMAKATGRSGLSGFYETIEELGKIDDVAKRGQEAMRIFGRSGMELMPIITAAKDSTDALQTVVAGFGNLPPAAAAAGGRVDDMMGFVVEEMKSIWLQGLGAICGWIDNEFPSSAAQSSLSVCNKMTYYAKLGAARFIAAYRRVQEYLKRFGDSVGAFIGTKMGGGTWGEAWDNAGKAYDQAVDEYADAVKEINALEKSRTERFKREFEQRAIAVSKFDEASKKAAAGILSRENIPEKEAEKAAAALDGAIKSPQVRNELLLAGNEANRLAMLGPTMQNEAKKQTALLEKIADNTKNVADNTDETANDETYGVFNG